VNAFSASTSFEDCASTCIGGALKPDNIGAALRSVADAIDRLAMFLMARPAKRPSMSENGHFT
jgi:hypothetical protein